MPSTITIDYECDNCSKRVRSDGQDGQTPEGWTIGGIGPEWEGMHYFDQSPNDWYCDECNTAALQALQRAIDERKGLYA